MLGCYVCMPLPYPCVCHVLLAFYIACSLFVESILRVDLQPSNREAVRLSCVHHMVAQLLGSVDSPDHVQQISCGVLLYSIDRLVEGMVMRVCRVAGYIGKFDSRLSGNGAESIACPLVCQQSGRHAAIGLLPGSCLMFMVWITLRLCCRCKGERVCHFRRHGSTCCFAMAAVLECLCC